MTRPSSRAACTAASSPSASRKRATRNASRWSMPLPFPLDLGSGPARDALHLPHGDHGQETYEEQEAREEQPEAAHEDAHVELRGYEHAPARRQERPVQRHDDDDEALAPHADVDQ